MLYAQLDRLSTAPFFVSLTVAIATLPVVFVWGWAQGNVQATRQTKDRVNGKHVRNPHANVTLWRIKASRLRAFTHREYARLQTFPDIWEFMGASKRDIHQ